VLLVTMFGVAWPVAGSPNGPGEGGGEELTSGVSGGHDVAVDTREGEDFVCRGCVVGTDGERNIAGELEVFFDDVIAAIQQNIRGVASGGEGVLVCGGCVIF
jgi:hypothetical protein